MKHKKYYLLKNRYLGGKKAVCPPEYAYTRKVTGNQCFSVSPKNCKMSEKKFEKRLRETVKKLKGLALKFYCLSFTGMPDRLVLMPGGRLWFVELKSPGKKPTPRQLFVQGFLTRLGFQVRIIDSSETLENFINEIR